MNISSNVVKELAKIFSSPPTQGPVGRSPETYVQEAGLENCAQLILSEIGGTYQQLNRQQVRKFCMDNQVPVLCAYAVAMAWGGQRIDHYRTTMDDPSRGALINLLEQLRNSNSSRQADFALGLNALPGIKGLGISFFTKLLYFFRPNADAYILDQWTAKSMVRLFTPSPVRIRNELPSPDTTSVEYEAYCKCIDQLAEELKKISNKVWMSEQAEAAIFDKPRGDWRITLGEPADDEEEEGERGSPAGEIVYDSGRPIYLYQCHKNDDALTLRDDCEKKKNDGWICREHSWLDFKLDGRSPRYLIGEIDQAGGDFYRKPGYAPSLNESTHCMGGVGYEGRVLFTSIEACVRYLKKYFTVLACPCNTRETQAWINSL